MSNHTIIGGIKQRAVLVLLFFYQTGDALDSGEMFEYASVFN